MDILDRAWNAAVRTSRTSANGKQKAVYHILFHRLRPTDEFQNGMERALVSSQTPAVDRGYAYLSEQSLVLDWRATRTRAPAGQSGG